MDIGIHFTVLTLIWMVLCVTIKHDKDFCFEILKSTLKNYDILLYTKGYVFSMGVYEIKIYSFLSDKFVGIY